MSFQLLLACSIKFDLLYVMLILFQLSLLLPIIHHNCTGSCRSQCIIACWISAVVKCWTVVGWMYFNYKNGTSISFDYVVWLAPEIFPIMLVLWSMLLHTCYAKNYAGIINSGLFQRQIRIRKSSAYWSTSWNETLCLTRTLFPSVQNVWKGGSIEYIASK